jgi:NAD(P)-dependent dehydrogenase (short-subunit alcohol dehydrogenase family)
MIDLTSKVAIVTGGGSGIGAAVALSLAASGARVAVCGRRVTSIDRTVEQIKAQGGVGLAVPADVAVEEDVQRLVQTTVAAFGDVDILVNNAAIGGGGQIHEHNIDAWDQIMAVNLRGPFLLCHHVLPIMRHKRSGHIINISSESGLNHYPGDGAYGISKHALNALGEYIQRENQEHNIRVNTICPGMVVTEMTENSPGLNTEKALDPSEIADLVLWLVSRQRNLKIGTPILIQTMDNPWE